MERRYTGLTKLAFGLFAMIFAVQVYRAIVLPVNTVEAYTYDRFVRPTTRQVLALELPNRDVLYSLLEKRSVGLFHVSPFSVRLPGLGFASLYLWSLWRLGRLLLGTGGRFPLGVALAGLLPLRWDLFAHGQGVGTALALDLCATLLAIEYLTSNQHGKTLKLNISGAFLGLSVAACLDFAIPSAALGLALLAALALQQRSSLWADRVLIPAVVVALVLLVLPLSHAHAAPETTPDLTVPSAANLQSVLLVLRASAGSNYVTIGASPAVEPIINFYRAQHRVTTWGRADRGLLSRNFDYYLLVARDGELVEQRHLVVLYRDGDFVLARRIPDGT